MVGRSRVFYIHEKDRSVTPLSVTRVNRMIEQGYTWYFISTCTYTRQHLEKGEVEALWSRWDPLVSK